MFVRAWLCACVRACVRACVFCVVKSENVKGYQEIQNKGYLISLGHEEITEIAQIAQSLGHSRSAQAYNTLVELKKITPTRLQNEPPHFYNLTNPDESFDVRSIEREIREQLHFYETKVKPLMV